jgi:uncharacterized protein YndB with AHSA1/START domain
MSTTPTVPYRLEFSVEVPGTPEQVWHAIATATGMSAWFLPTEMEEREGGSLHFTMGPEMGSDGQVTGWDPPRRFAYAEDWAALMGKEPADLRVPRRSAIRRHLRCARHHQRLWDRRRLGVRVLG